MKKYTILGVIILGLLITPVSIQAAGLTSSQIQSILSLLSSFGANQSVIASVQTALSGGTLTNPSSSFCYNFNTDLTVGSSGNDVLALNQALSLSGIGTANNTSRFAENNAGDVVSFQAKYGIRQTGYVGPITRAKLNALYGCTTTNPTNPSSTLSCQNKWWFDSSHPTCSQSQFCGEYMYLGLQTFSSQANCQAAIPSSAPIITTTSLPNGTVGASYNASITGSGGSGTYRWSATGLPNGLFVDGISCTTTSGGSCPTIAAIHGTPTTAGTYPVTITITSYTPNGQIDQTATATLNVVISDSLLSLPFCGQPPMPTCPAGLSCVQVMPAPKTYTNYNDFINDKAQHLYEGNCK